MHDMRACASMQGRGQLSGASIREAVSMTVLALATLLLRGRLTGTLKAFSACGLGVFKHTILWFRGRWGSSIAFLLQFLPPVLL